MKRHAQLYLLIVTVVGCGIFYILHLGSHLPAPGSPNLRPTIEHVTGGDATLLGSLVSSLGQNSSDPLTRLFLQLFVVIVASYVVGWIFTRCGQPSVVGEMMAGVLLGPSFFGFFAPDAFQFVFAASSLDALKLFSQLGVCLFMFAVGMEMDVS